MTTSNWEDRERGSETPESVTPESGPFVIEPATPMPTPTPAPAMPETPGSTESGAERAMPTRRSTARKTSSRKAGSRKTGSRKTAR